MFYLEMDSSQIATFMECPQKWYYSYQEHLHKNTSNRKPLDKGSLMHFLLEYYRRDVYFSKDSGKSMTYAWAAAQDRMAESKALGEEWKLTPEEKEMIRIRFVQYLLRWQSEEYETELWDGEPAVEIGFSVDVVKNEYYHFVLSGKIDWLAKTRNGYSMFVDYKTQARKYDVYKRRIQFKNYALATNRNRGVIDVIGLQKDYKPEYMSRTLGVYPPEMLKLWGLELVRIFYAAYNCIFMNKYPKNWNSCDGKFGECPYTMLCESTNQKTFDYFKESNYTKIQEWTPHGEPFTENGD